MFYLQEMFEANDELQSKVQSLLNTGEHRMANCQHLPAVQDKLHRHLDELSSRWDAVKLRFIEHSQQLSTACDEAQLLHSSLTDMMSWLSDLEQTLHGQAPVSRVLETVNTQIQQHQVFEIFHC